MVNAVVMTATRGNPSIKVRIFRLIFLFLLEQPAGLSRANAVGQFRHSRFDAPSRKVGGGQGMANPTKVQRFRRKCYVGQWPVKSLVSLVSEPPAFEHLLVGRTLGGTIKAVSRPFPRGSLGRQCRSTQRSLAFNGRRAAAFVFWLGESPDRFIESFRRPFESSMCLVPFVLYFLVTLSALSVIQHPSMGFVKQFSDFI